MENRNPDVTKNNSRDTFKSYCKKCKQYFYGWGKEICPVCGNILTGLKKKRK